MEGTRLNAQAREQQSFRHAGLRWRGRLIKTPRPEVFFLITILLAGSYNAIITPPRRRVR